MVEYVSKEAVKEAFQPLPGMDEYCVLEMRTAKELVDGLPAADVVPVVRSTWGRRNDAIVCQNCGFGMFPLFTWSKNGRHIRTTFVPRFCPDCGARMEPPHD